jgi:hypothetical protein
MFCASRLIFGGTEGVGSLFHILHCWTRFRRYQGRRVPFSLFTRPDSFPEVPGASGPILLFCAHGLIFSGTKGVVSCFHVLCSGTRFRRCRVRRVPFSCFVLSESFSALPRAPGPVFMCCAPVLVFGGTEGVGSHFHVLCSRTHFRRCRVRQVPFSRFELLVSFSVITRA